MNLNAQKICLAIIQWGTYLILLTPLVVIDGFFFLFVGPKTLYFWALTEIIFAAWLFLLFLNPEYRPRRNIILIALSIFLFCLILSTVFGADVAKSFWSNFERMSGLLTWLHLFVFFLVLSSVFKKKSGWHKIFALSVSVAIVVSLLSIFPKLGLPDILKGLPTQEGATLGNTSFLATYLLFNAFLALYLCLQARPNRIVSGPARRAGGPARRAGGDKLKILSGAGFILITLALLSSTGYTAIISFFLGLVLLGIFWLIFRPGPVCRLLGIAFLGILLIAGGVLLFLIFQPNNSLHQAIVANFSKSRFIVWRIAWAGWLNRPLLGWGPENFDLAFYRHFHPCLFLPICSPEGAIWFDRAHNILFDTLVTLGIFGLLSYLGLLLSVFYWLWKRHFQKTLHFWTANVFSALLIAYFVQNMTVFDMLTSYMMFFLILGFIAGPPKLAEVRPLPTLAGRKKKVLVLCVVLVLLGFSLFKFVVQPLRADYYAMRAVNTQDSQKRLTLFQKCLSASSLGKYQIREFFADSLMRKMPSDNLEPELAFLTSELQKSTESSPFNFRSYLKLGQLYNFWGRIDSNKFFQAEQVLKKAIEISPTNQYGYWALSDTEVALGELQKAVSLLEKAVELEPRLEKSRQKLEAILGLTF